MKNNLANNERILYRAKLHWWIYLKSILLVIVGIIIGLLAKDTKAADAGYTILGVLFVIGVVGFINAYIRSNASEFVVTNRRIMLKTGTIKRKLTELQLNRAEGLRIDQTVMGRVFNYGSIIITSGGVTETFSPVDKPYEFKKEINNAIEVSYPGNNNPSMNY